MEHDDINSSLSVSSSSGGRSSITTAAANKTSTPRTLTYLNGLSLLLGLQIGSGIFSSPATVITLIPSPPWAVAIWASAGFLVWTGAASFAELGALCPGNGGMLQYLRYCYGSEPGEAGDALGFLFSWIWIAMVKPCAMGMIAMISAEYFFQGFASMGAAATVVGKHDNALEVKGTALLAILLVTWLNCTNAANALGTAKIFLAIKLLALGTIIISALLLTSGMLVPHNLDKPGSRLLDSPNLISRWTAGKTAQEPQIHVRPMAIPDALLAALFAFGGWESVGFFAGEISNPHQTIPRILFSAMLTIMSLFVLTVWAFYTFIPSGVLEETNAVAVVSVPPQPSHSIGVDRGEYVG